MAQAFSLSGQLSEYDRPVIDVDQWLSTFAAANLMGISDTVRHGGDTAQHRVLSRPDDGKV